MFRTPPEEMHILTRNEVYEYGFLLRDETVRNSGTGPSLEERAVAVMLDFNGTWSESNEAALSKIESFYGPSIRFYGKTVSRADVMAEKAAFAKRWPDRVYAVQPETLSVSCRESTCVVSGNVVWDARSAKRGAVSTGVAYSALTVEFSGETATIIGEDGHVLKRD